LKEDSRASSPQQEEVWEMEEELYLNTFMPILPSTDRPLIVDESIERANEAKGAVSGLEGQADKGFGSGEDPTFDLKEVFGVEDWEAGCKMEVEGADETSLISEALAAGYDPKSWRSPWPGSPASPQYTPRSPEYSLPIRSELWSDGR
jgi:hypothetical protein